MAFPVQPLQGLKITVPTAVLVDGEQPLLLLRDGDEFGGLSVRRSKGLVDNDVATCEETLFGLLEVRCIRSSDDDQAVELMASNSSRLRTIAASGYACTAS